MKIKEKTNEIKLNKFEKINEPEDFFISTDFSEGLILDSKEDIDALLKKLKMAEYDDKLAEFCSNFTNRIKDLTKD